MHPGGYTTYWRKRWKKGLHKDHLLWVMIDWFVDHAAFEDKEIYFPNYGTVKLKRGQVVFGSISLGEFLGASRKRIRSRTEILRKLEFLVTKRTNKFSIATILNYDEYQDQESKKGQQKGQRRANRGPTEGQQRATTNTYNTLSKKLIIHLNKISGRKFTTEANIDYVIPRLKQGYTFEQCKSVINKKWKDEDFNKKYFCPETLFRRSKFEKYINEDIGVEKCSNQTGKLQTTDEIDLAKWEKTKTK